MNRGALNTRTLGSGVQTPNLFLQASQALQVLGDLVVALPKGLSAAVDLTVEGVNSMAHRVSLVVSQVLSVTGAIVASSLRPAALEIVEQLNVAGTLTPKTRVALYASLELGVEAAFVPTVYRGLHAEGTLTVSGSLSATGYYTGAAPESRRFVTSCPADRTFTMAR